MENTEKLINEKVESFRLQLIKELVKPKFEVGKWYKRDKSIWFIKEISETNQTLSNYGFDYKGNWMDEEKRCFAKDKDYTLATPDEVKQALTKEAIKREFTGGVEVKCLHNNGWANPIIIGTFFMASDKLWANGNTSNALIFDAGKWATVIPKEKTTECYIIEMTKAFCYDVSHDATGFYKQWFKANNLKITKS